MGRIIYDGVPFHIDNYRHYLGRTIGTSDWFLIDQERVNGFARATDDHNKLHVDPAWARANSPFGAPIAHGFLTLSMMTQMSMNADMMPDGVDYGINLGFDRVRFLAPVPVNNHIRMKSTLIECEDRGGGRWTFKSRCNVEVKETEKVALSAIWQVLFINLAIAAAAAEAKAAPVVRLVAADADKA